MTKFEEKMTKIIASMQAPECQRGDPTLDKLVLQNDLPAIIRELSSLLQTVNSPSERK